MEVICILRHVTFLLPFIQMVYTRKGGKKQKQQQKNTRRPRNQRPGLCVPREKSHIKNHDGTLICTGARASPDHLQASPSVWTVSKKQTTFRALCFCMSSVGLCNPWQVLIRRIAGAFVPTPSCMVRQDSCCQFSFRKIWACAQAHDYDRPAATGSGKS